MDIELTEMEQDLVCLVLESQPVAIEELLRLCSVRLKLNNEQAWGGFGSLLERELLTLADGRVSVHIPEEELEKIVLERAAEKAQAQAAERRKSSARAHYFERQEAAQASGTAAGSGQEKAPEPGPDASQGPDRAAGTQTGGAGEHLFLLSTPELEQDPEPEPERRRRSAPRWRAPVLIGAAVLLVLAVVAIPLLRLLTATYPRTLKLAGRQVTLRQQPADKAQREAEDWLIKYVKGKTNAGLPAFSTLTVVGMETCELKPGWRQALPYDMGGFSADPPLSVEGKVVFLDALETGEDPGQKTAYQYRIYLEGDDKRGYEVTASRSCLADWMRPYDTETFKTGGKTYTLSLCGEAAENGHRLRMASLSDGQSQEVLYLTEQTNTVYAAQHHLRDLNGDGQMDLIIDTQYATQLCYLYDESAGGYALFEPLSGGRLVYSDALPGAVLYTDFSEPKNTSYLYQWSGGTQLSELARMEMSTSESGERVYHYYLEGEHVRQHTQDDGGGGLGGDWREDQVSLFKQYMAYAGWDELVVSTALEHGCLALPEGETPAEEDWAPFQLREAYPERDLYLYVSPSGLLLVQKDGRFQSIPCAFNSLTRAPSISDLSGNGNLELLVPFNSLSPALLLARWTDGGWALTGFDLGALETDFAQNTTAAQRGEDLAVRYAGAYGRSSASWPGALAPQDGAQLCLNLDGYTVTVREAGAALTLEFPVRILKMDGSAEEGPLKLTALLRVPLEGMPEIVSCKLTDS